jgi:LPPG:FO 2-phospho-L-lactate transferase
VSPIVGGRALKGPADRMLAVDEEERSEVEALGMRALATDAIMHDAPDRTRLAREVLEFGAGLVSR